MCVCSTHGSVAWYRHVVCDGTPHTSLETHIALKYELLIVEL